MTRREAWLSAGAVFLVALLIRIWAATQITFPQPEDTAYYVDVARNLIAGHGLTTDAIWSYATPPLTFNPPRPAFEIWLPVATFLDAIPMALGGSSFAAAQVASILEGSILAVLAWRLGADVAEDLALPAGRGRVLALGAGLAAAAYLPLVLFSVQPDSTTPFAILVLLGVLLIRRILRATVVVPPPAPRPAFKLSRKPPRRPKPAYRSSSSGGTTSASRGTPPSGGSTSASRGTPPSGGLTSASRSTPPSHQGDSSAHDGNSHPGHDQGRHTPSTTMAYDADGHARRTLSSAFGVAGAAGRAATWSLVALGAVIGVAGLTRNDAVYLAMVWAVIGWRATRPAATWTGRIRAALWLVGVPAVVAIAIYVPWAIRDLLAFGTALPGQALQNALFLNGRDVFAWDVPPTLERYLAAGPPTLLGLRLDGFVHNLGSVLLLLGIPISALGLAGLPWAARVPALRALAGFSLLSFAVATLVFPVATTWGTFLHAAGAIHVLILISALLVLDRLIERVRIAREWTRPVAWLGPAAATAASLLLALALVPVQGAAGRATEATYQALPLALDQAGVPLPTDGTPVITDFPIWLSTEDHVHAIALPNEQPSDVLALATQFNAKLLIVNATDDGQWPEILDGEANESQCFQLIDLPGGASATPGTYASAEPGTGPLGDILAFRIICSSNATQQTP
ncbi:MAG TPA: hypothetical protein VFW20_02755 [Candidatus Limnocylindrales bacterium]|nr:hypothetical protein [Candidatus Limnocylindrales bacterium]